MKVDPIGRDRCLKQSSESSVTAVDYSFRPLVQQTKGFYFDWKNCEIISISYPAEGESRVRRFSTRRNRKITWRYPGFKSGRMHEAESYSELMAFQALDGDPSVIGFYEQPARIKYRIDGRVFPHVPDLLVELPNRKEFWEVKLDPKEEFSEVFRRAEFLNKLLREEGYGYRLVFGSELRNSVELHNAKQLLKFGRGVIDIFSLEASRALFESLDRVRLQQFSVFGDGLRDKSLLYALVLNKYVAFDAGHLINKTSNFSWIKN